MSAEDKTAKNLKPQTLLDNLKRPKIIPTYSRITQQISCGNGSGRPRIRTRIEGKEELLCEYLPVFPSEIPEERSQESELRTLCLVSGGSTS